MKNLVFGLIILIAFDNCQAQEFSVMFYNVENLFDCEDDSLKNDEDYLEGGMRAWNFSKYRRKLNNISKVIVSASEWDSPSLVGMCEVESDRALYDLTRTTGLKNLGYSYVHYESADARGVDVALLYRTMDVKLIRSDTLCVSFPDSPKSKTRDVLFAAFIVQGVDTLNVFVCHLPSRLGGETATDEKRRIVAGRIRKKVDDLLHINAGSNILIMGDMNDYPDNNSMRDVLKAKHPDDAGTDGDLFNLMYPMHLKGDGTHKYEAEWGALDQIIVSNALKNGKGRFVSKSANIVKLPYLLVEDGKFFGMKPFRTYEGVKYAGGYSDHLPVSVKIKMTDKK